MPTPPYNGVLVTPISDHLPFCVSLKIKSTKPKPSYITCPLLQKVLAKLICIQRGRKVQRTSLDVHCADDVNNKLSIHNVTLQSTLDSHAPIKTIKIRARSCPFVIPKRKQLMREGDQLHSLFIKARDTQDWDNYKIARNNVKSTPVNAQRENLSTRA